MIRPIEQFQNQEIKLPTKDFLSQNRTHSYLFPHKKTMQNFILSSYYFKQKNIYDTSLNKDQVLPSFLNPSIIINLRRMLVTNIYLLNPFLGTPIESIQLHRCCTLALGPFVLAL